MAKTAYSCTTEGAVVCGAATAVSIIGVAGTADFGVNLKKYRLAFDGVTASAVPALVELCYATFATNAPGTASTTVTVRQDYGRVLTAGFTAAKTWTTEPTVLTVLESYILTPNGGAIVYDYPLGDEPDSAFSQGFVVRVTAPAAVNARASLVFERC